MTTIEIALTEGMKALLEARLEIGDYANVNDYVRDLIENDLAATWKIDRATAVAIDEGEASGYSDKSLEEIFAEARAKYRAS